MRLFIPILLVCEVMAPLDWRVAATGGQPGVRPHGVNRGYQIALGQGQDNKATGSDKKSQPRFTIGKDTTFVTGPVDKEGYIDYCSALNERLRQGVTPENNACVLLWKALGPQHAGETMPAEYFRLLGIAAVPEEGEYFVDLFRYMKTVLKLDPKKQAGEIHDQLDRTIQRPWTAEEYPKIAGWLKENEKPMALIDEATKRSHYYSPVLVWKKENKPFGFGRVIWAETQMHRQLAQLWVARAMLRLEEGRYDEAWQDLLACHRLGRLVRRGGVHIDHVVSNFIDNTACDGDLAFLDRAKLDAKRVKECLLDLQTLPASVPLADIVDLGERFAFLDSIMCLDRGGVRDFGLAKAGKGVAVKPISKDPLPDIDWDPALRSLNDLCDRLAAVLRITDRPSREKVTSQKTQVRRS